MALLTEDAFGAIVAETGPLSAGVDIVLVHHGGGRSDARGVVARLPQSPAEVTSAYSDSGLCAWTPTPSRPDDVAFVEIVKTGERHRVIHAERKRSAVNDLTRYMLQEASA